MKKYFKFSDKTRRIIIVLMIINSFAFLVNFLNVTPKITTKTDSGYEHWYYIFTDGNVYSSNDLDDRVEGIKYSCDEDREKYKNFWPFLNYRNVRQTSIDHYKFCIKEEFFYHTKFRGVFPDYDISEFIIFSILIFGIPIVKKIW